MSPSFLAWPMVGAVQVLEEQVNAGDQTEKREERTEYRRVARKTTKVKPPPPISRPQSSLHRLGNILVIGVRSGIWILFALLGILC